MQNMLVIGIYAPFCAVTAIILGIEIIRPYKRGRDYLFALLCFYALGWYIVNIWGLATHNEDIAQFCIRFMLVFVSLITPTLLLFILQFYAVEIPFRLPKYWQGLLFVVPAVTLLMVLTSGAHTLLVSQLDFLSLIPVREMVVVWGPWFWVHTAYSYSISFIIIAVIVVQHIRASRFYRQPSTMMVLGVALTLVGNLVTLFQIIPPVIEPTLISMSLSLIFFSLAIFNNNNSKFVRFSKAHIYHYLAEYILVLDVKDQIIDFNRAAGEWFEKRGIPLASASLESVTAALLQKGEYTTDAAPEDTTGRDIAIRDGIFPVILNQRVYHMKDALGASIGKIVVFSDVTQNRTLIEQLESKAGMDTLTSLPNYNAYAGARARLDTAPHMPLSVIMADANKLKQTNDTLGHEYGDLLLQTVAGCLEKACPRDGFVARIGGDEFIYLLPGTPLEKAEALIAEVNKRLAAINDLPFPVSVAFGAATKYYIDEDLAEVTALADARMYENKKGNQASTMAQLA